MTARRQALMETAAQLFAEKSFGGVSIREICKAAGASINMVHHYFGNKDGLLSAILAEYDQNVFAIPMRIIEDPPESREDFLARIDLLFRTTLDAYADHRNLIIVATREQADLPALSAYQAQFTRFLDAAKAKGVVRDALDPSLIVAAMLDRIMNQVLFAPWILKTSGADVLTDKSYRRRWCAANLDFFLNGMLAERAPKP